MSSSSPIAFVRQTTASMGHVTLHQNAQVLVAQLQEHVPSHLESAVSSVLAVARQPQTTTPMPSSLHMLHPLTQIRAPTEFASSRMMFVK